jgi:transcriptional regulator with XRE-family HTH domain
MSGRSKKARDVLRDFRKSIEADNATFRESSRVTQNAETIIQSIRSRLRDERLKYRIDQKDLASRMGVSQSAVSKFETERGDAGLRTVTRMADALGLVPLVAFVPKKSISAAQEDPKLIIEMIGAAQSELLSQITRLIVR